jgi:hypothetical protein
MEICTINSTMLVKHQADSCVKPFSFMVKNQRCESPSLNTADKELKWYMLKKKM